MDCYFNTSAAQAMRRATSPLYKGTTICSEELTITFQKKKKLQMRQCWQIGFSILELSKLVMAKIYYLELIPRLGAENVSLIMSDTDSFLFLVRGHTEEEALSKLEPIMDFSNLAKDHPLYSSVREKLPGFLKNEIPLARILRAVALKAKSYAIFTEDGETRAAAKGVKESVKRLIPFETYLACVEKDDLVEVTQTQIGSKNHVNRLTLNQRVAFSSLDDKRYQLCSCHSVPYGSKIIREFERTGICPFCRDNRLPC